MATITMSEAFGDAMADHAFFEDPYPIYDALRASAPVQWSERFRAWIVTDYAGVDAVIRDVARFSNARRIPALLQLLPDDVQDEIRPLREHFSHGLVHSDPPDHDRIRALVNRAFTPRVVEGMRSRIEEIVDGLLDRVEPDGRMDLVADLAYPLPVTVICELAGIPVEDHNRFRIWSTEIFGFLGTGQPKIEAVRRAQMALQELETYFLELFRQRRTQPQDDFITALVRLERDGGLSQAELLSLFSTFVSAGHETTTSLIATGLSVLLAHPDQLARVGADRSLLRPVVEEMLRFESPLQRDMKVSTVDLRLGDQSIRAGDLVWALLGAANRDPARFPDPHRFDAGRTDNRHLAFGLGPHFCLGAPLARLEATIVLDRVLRRLPALRLGSQTVEWRQDYALRGPLAVQVEF